MWPLIDNLTNVLVIDDALEDRLLIKRLFKRLNSNVKLHEANTVRAAADSLGQTIPDLIVLDHQLPDGSAFDVIEQLKEIDQTQNLHGGRRSSRDGISACPVLVTTASGNEQLAISLVRAGASDYVPKDAIRPTPVNGLEAASRTFARVVSRAIEQQRLSRRAAILRHQAVRKRRELRRIAADAQRAKQQLDLAITGADLCVWTWQSDDRVIRLGDGSGQSFGAVATNTPDNLILAAHDDDQDALSRSFASAVEQATAIASSRDLSGNLPADAIEDLALEFRIAAGGDYRWTQLRGRPVRVETTDDGDTVVHLTGVLLDIDQRKRGQIAVTHARDEAVQAKQRVSDLLGSINDGFIAVDHAYRYTHINAAAERMIGYKAEDAVGRNIFAMFPSDRDQPFAVALRRAVEHGEAAELESYSDAVDRWFNIRIYASHGGASVFFVDITTDKRREEALREVELTKARQLAQLRAIYRTSPIGLAFVDVDQTIVRVSEAFAQMHNKTSQELQDQQLQDTLDRGLAAKLLPVYRRVVDQRESCVLELDVGPNQSMRQGTYMCRYSPVIAEADDGTGDETGESEAGQCLGVNVVVQDITEQKRAMADLRKSNAAVRAADAQLRRNFAELNAIYDTNPVGLAFVDHNLLYQRMNKTLGTYLGVDSEAAVGKSPKEILPRGMVSRLWPLYREVIEKGEAQEILLDGAELQPGKDRSNQVFLARYSPVKDRAGETVGMNIVVQDITGITMAQKRLAEQSDKLEHQAAELRQRGEELARRNNELSDVNNELAQATAQLSALIGNAPVGFGFFDRQCRALRVNKPFVELAGVDSSDQLGRPLREILREMARPMEEAIRSVFDTGKPVADLEVSGKLARHHGRQWWLVSLFPVINAGVEAVGAVVLDITDRKRAEHQLREAKDHAESARISADRARQIAEQASAAKSEFLAVLSHELRTPLTPVLAGSQLLEAELGKVQELAEIGQPMSPEQSETFSDVLEMIRRNVSLEVRIIDDLLDLTRITRGKLQLSRRVVDLNQSIQHVIEICRSDLSVKKIELEIDLSQAPLPVYADAARVQQVLWNLLKNAVKFTPDRGRIIVRSSRDRATNEACCTVIDTGVGIAREKLQSIFNAFEQGDALVTRTFGGLGLGLAISRQLAQMHRGTLSADSGGRNQGSTFTFCLPIHSAATLRADQPKAKPLSGSLANRRVLLIEDHADTSRLMSRFLRSKLGLVVTHAGNITDGLSSFKTGGPFDLIISDIGLPDGTGLQLLENITAHCGGREKLPPAIALSGYGTETDVARSKTVGFRTHLVKPVDLDRLVSAVHELLDRADR